MFQFSRSIVACARAANRAWILCAAASMTLSLLSNLQAGAQCQPLPNGGFEGGVKGWTFTPDNTQTGNVSAESGSELVNGDDFGPPLQGLATLITVYASAQGGEPGSVNQSHSSMTLSTQAMVTDRFLTFDGFGSWEVLRMGAFEGSYALHVEADDGRGHVAQRVLATFGPPPALPCSAGMSILGIILSDGPFTLDVLFNGAEPTGINIGDTVTLRLRLECTASAELQNCDEGDVAAGLFVDGFRFCPAMSSCPDITGDAAVDVDDLIAVILGWGECPEPPTECSADVDTSGAVDVDDLIAVILGWGECP